ncbi:hypothetical protein EV130_101102 [Rhizobium azibense]|uniref:Uncharacterized protein n=1 Tax=Rhizobium azibense TaxID=1136135 RepID=A0A4R3R6Y5_9HYPH|nr:hypothetical protein EV130_101102 [Rhizobium azibense]
MMSSEKLAFICAVAACAILLFTIGLSRPD